MIYRVIDPRLRAWRDKSYNYRQLFIFSMLVFFASVFTGGALYFVVAGPSYLIRKL